MHGTTELKKQRLIKASMIAFFKPAAADTNGEVKKDVLEIIELNKKIVKEYGGEEIKVEINEN